MYEIKDANLLDYAICVSLFDELNSNELIQVVDYLRLVGFDKDEVLFRENEPGTFACYVYEGELSVSKLRGDTEVVIADISEGRSIGEMALFDSFPRSATVRTTTPGKLIMLTEERFDQLIEEHPRLGVKILRRLARLMSLNLRKTSATVADLMQTAT